MAGRGIGRLPISRSHAGASAFDAPGESGPGFAVPPRPEPSGRRGKHDDYMTEVVAALAPSLPLPSRLAQIDKFVALACLDFKLGRCRCAAL